MTGLSEAEAAGKGWANALHPEDCEDVFTHWNQCTQTGQEFLMEHRFQTPDNHVTWVSSSAVAYYDNNNKILGYLGNSYRHYGRKRLLYKNVNRQNYSFKQKRDFSEAVINTAGALVAVLDRQGAIVSFNHTCEKITGYSFAEVKGKRIWDLLILPEEKNSG